MNNEFKYYSFSPTEYICSAWTYPLLVKVTINSKTTTSRANYNVKLGVQNNFSLFGF